MAFKRHAGFPRFAADAPSRLPSCNEFHASQLGISSGNSVDDGDDFFVSFQVQQTQLPEPASLALFGVGLLGFGVAERRCHHLARWRQGSSMSPC